MGFGAVTARLLVLAVATFVVAVLSLPDAAHAHSEPVSEAQHVVQDIHADGAETSGLGHCHGEASCSSGLHIVHAAGAITPDAQPLPAPDRAPVLFKGIKPGHEPPVPIARL